MASKDKKSFWQFQRKTCIQFGRAVNTSLDGVFYDITSLSAEERSRLSDYPNPEGSVLIVYPQKNSQEISNLTPLEFISTQKQKGAVVIDAIVVAGVGSSALGTAALARNVADTLDRPVAGIVSGLGIADLVSEAMGGWFVLGLKNSFRDSFAKVFDTLELKDHVWEDTSYRSLVKDAKLADFDFNRFVYGSPDATALLLILYHLHKKINILVGHSKGNYIIENALEGLIDLCKLKKQKLPDHLKIVTMGAVIRFPDEFEPKVIQYIGNLDGFGLMNSRLNLKSNKIKGAWHSLNTALPGHLSVEKAITIAGIS